MKYSSVVPGGHALIYNIYLVVDVLPWVVLHEQQPKLCFF